MNHINESTRREIISQHVWHHTNATSGWLAMKEVPEPWELLKSSPPEIAPLLDISAQTKQQYLETQYRLLRCEGTDLLRQAVLLYRSSPHTADGEKFHVYTQVRVQGYFCTAQGAACRVSFSTERSPTKVLWDQSESLTEGTLVALSPKSDEFRTKCLVATVAYRTVVGGLMPDPHAGEDESTPPRIELYWAKETDAVINPAEELVMIEAKGGYFEGVRYAMLGLQLEASKTSKFDKYIVHCSDTLEPAAYLGTREAPIIPAGVSHLDETQREAFQCMTYQELAIVQGPPGTGKTHTSVLALESYSRTFSKSRAHANSGPVVPVVVSAQTNHALDQILNHCIKSDISVVRFGGRTQSETMKEHTMFQFRQNSKLRPRTSQLQKSRGRLITTMQQLLGMCFPRGLISAADLERYGLITADQMSSLLSTDWEAVSDDGTSPLRHSPASGQDDDALKQWLDHYIEKDLTYIYTPPQHQTQPEGTADIVTDAERGALKTDMLEQEERERPSGEFIPIELHMTGSVQPGKAGSLVHQAARILANCTDLYEIKPSQRGLVYRYLRSLLVDKAAHSFRQCLIEYKKVCSQIKAARWEADVEILRSEGVQIVGCTTTGLTKYRGLLAALKPRVLVIEEAAETREANITSGLIPSLDQLVLVGDHQQLNPHVDVSALVDEPYNFNISLFQRLVEARVPYAMLKVQRRMIPSIREIVNTFYRELRDHQSVSDPAVRPPVPGMGCVDHWWFHHEWEQSVDSTPSYFNQKEADMIVGFALYLVQNGLKRSEITVLTCYSGQKAILEERLAATTIVGKEPPEGDEWCVRTVDSFQGEENEVILLSMVRSSSQRGKAKAGFLENENRATVALSRARRGLYVFGNATNLLRSSAKSLKTWERVIQVFCDHGRFGSKMPLTCANHGVIIEMEEPDEWAKIPGGGCKQRCDQQCKNGHQCETTCHPTAQSTIQCRYPCRKKLPCTHECASLCGQECRCRFRCNATPVAQPLHQEQTPSSFTSAPRMRDYAQTQHIRRTKGANRGQISSQGRAWAKLRETATPVARVAERMEHMMTQKLEVEAAKTEFKMPDKWAAMIKSSETKKLPGVGEAANKAEEKKPTTSSGGDGGYKTVDMLLLGGGFRRAFASTD